MCLSFNVFSIFYVICSWLFPWPHNRWLSKTWTSCFENQWHFEYLPQRAELRRYRCLIPGYRDLDFILMNHQLSQVFYVLLSWIPQRALFIYNNITNKTNHINMKCHSKLHCKLQWCFYVAFILYCTLWLMKFAFQNPKRYNIHRKQERHEKQNHVNKFNINCQNVFLALTSCCGKE